MLKQRVITALVLAVIVIGAIALLPRNGFALFVAVVIGIGAWEWSGMMRLAPWQRVAHLLLFCCLMLALLVAGTPMVLPLMLLSALWWLVAFALVLRYPASEPLWQPRAILLLLSAVVLLPGVVALDFLRVQDPHAYYILAFIVLVAAADIGAYFTGRRLGSRRLAPLVSPNKTWEGVIGGMVGTVVAGLLMLAALPGHLELGLHQWVLGVLGALLLAAFSVVGDLFESMLKRHCQVKDSSNLLPGHGGILDRLDSLTAALPVYVLTLSALGLL
ncbi:MAG TPA: CDP-archaeol synthase [Hyphomicrobiales bacterium]|nr:CDP-archaeol synthase [Hyphomicrobiales bacterium]